MEILCVLNNSNGTPDYIKEILLKPYKYQSLRSSGTNVFNQFIDAFNVWLKVPEERLAIINKASELMFHAAIMLDDIQDNSPVRDGELAAHSVFGVAQTLNCANYLCFLALEEVRKMENLKAVEIFSGMDVYWRDTVTCPTEKEYFEIGLDKTVGHVRMVVRLMQIESVSETDYTGLVRKLGIHYQVLDDYMSLQSKQNAQDKGTFCEDIEEGKFSLPIIHSIQANPQNRQELLDIWKQRTKSMELKQHALKLLEGTGSFSHCRKFLEDLEQDIRNDIQKFGENAILEKIMNTVSIHKIK
ncbi:geranylgeranyl pyrophosphate synthase-like protein [Phascolomyces articulosus]|uniref:Geranylgeranyl pyrophosphate synthase-like protein n=1 Tax=Phascolomyces articulosus TaxID=60185 RepID=A0AAD5KMX9_9FUNG|nr:geranylgeranyl pyrophosphate synthase-like protein [Phascolomyces articulosus]